MWKGVDIIMRTIMVGIYLVFYSIICLIPFLILFLVGKRNPRMRAIISQKIVVNLGFKPILFICGVKMTVKGKENILKDESALYVFNHRGFFDILVGYCTAPYPTGFVSKVGIKKVPVISHWMKYMHCLFLERDDLKQGMKTILEGIEFLKGGTSIYIAPEGTRNQGDELLEFHLGSFKLAEKSKRPIVPVAINNTDAIFERQFPWIKRGHVIIEYCQPIYMDQMERAEKKKVGDAVREIIQEKVDQNKKEVRF